MSMRFWREWILCVLIGFSAFSARAQVLVYANSTDYENAVGAYTNEYGDQIDLVGTARVLTKIRFEYFGNFYPQGDERARVRIYANDGPFWKGNPDYPTPGTLLWDSGLFTIGSGDHVLDFVIPSIRAPNSITWTAQFFGVTMQSGIVTPDPSITQDTVGLLFYGNPEIGLNYNDFWERLPDGWAPVKQPDVLRNNFGAVVTAIPDAVVGQTSSAPPPLTVTVQGNFLDVTWPASSPGFVLQSKASADTGTWTDEETPAVPVGTQFQVVVPKLTPQQIFRLREETKAAKLEITRDATNVHLRWPASAKGYTLQVSQPGGLWSDFTTPTTPVGDYFDVIAAKDSVNKLFRLIQ